MKKKLFLALSGAVATAALVFTVFSANASSLHDLRAKANEINTYCKPDPTHDCKSGATGNIYTYYIVTPYPNAE